VYYAAPPAHGYPVMMERYAHPRAHHHPVREYRHHEHRYWR
jgi:hypothetical protein